MSEMATPSDDKRLVQAGCLCWDASRNQQDPALVKGHAEFLVYLCETCDSVHVSVASPALHGGLTQINASLTTRQAEKLARLLLAPDVVTWEET